jgi:hypothetical protein
MPRDYQFSMGHRTERRGGPADKAALRPVNPQERTRPGASANFRLCAKVNKEAREEP